MREFLETMGASIGVRGNDNRLREGLAMMKNLYVEYEIRRERDAIL